MNVGSWDGPLLSYIVESQAIIQICTNNIEFISLKFALFFWQPVQARM